VGLTAAPSPLPQPPPPGPPPNLGPLVPCSGPNPSAQPSLDFAQTGGLMDEPTAAPAGAVGGSGLSSFGALGSDDLLAMFPSPAASFVGQSDLHRSLSGEPALSSMGVAEISSLVAKQNQKIDELLRRNHELQRERDLHSGLAAASKPPSQELSSQEPLITKEVSTGPGREEVA